MGNEQLIIEYIKKYIVSDVYPDSAIMINGGWGSGKTYFIKNILVSNLEETLKIKEMHLCYITLNGLSSTKEFMKRIQSLIIKERFNVLNEVQKTDSGIIDIITGIDSICDDVNLQGWLSILFGAKKKIDSSISKKNISSTLFIFDDLERCPIDLKEILGFINDLIEHEHCKCIIVANEEEIEDSFFKIKEKFISRTFEFVPNLDDFLKNEREKYKDQPLNKLSDENWKGFIKSNLYPYKLNLRIVQSALFITNEIYNICINRILQEENDLSQYVLNRLLFDIYYVEKYYKEGNEKPQIKNNDNIENVVIFGSKNDLSSYKKIFMFILDVVYNGIYEEKVILKNIEAYIENNKINGIYSPIAELKSYYYMEDEKIQAILDLIHETVKNLNLNQLSDFFNSLIPLLDIGFSYNHKTDFESVLQLIADTVDISATENDWVFEKVEFHTTLKDEQFKKYKIAMNMMKEKLEKKASISNEYMDEILSSHNWIFKLQCDMKTNEYNYREEKKYLSYFNLDILLKNLEQSSNLQLSDFRTILYGLYRRNNCMESFINDIETALELVSKLETITINKKINKLTIKYIIGDLKASFSKD